MYSLSIILTLVSLLYPAQTANERLVAEILKRDLLVKERAANYERTLSLVTKGTKFENRWQVNQPVKDDYLNVFVLKAGIRNQPDLPTGLKDYFGSCTSLGEKNIVVCDDGFINTFLEIHNVPDMIKANPDRENEWRRHNESFLLWVLGHEIGHVVKGHGAAHFGPDNLEANVASSSIGYQRELEADAFLVDQVSKDREASLALIRMSLDLLNAEIRKQVGDKIPAGVGILFDYNNEKVVRYMRLRTHPEYVIRLTRVLQKLSHLEGYDGLKNLTDTFSHNLREGS
jgi:hypothetical protein